MTAGPDVGVAGERGPSAEALRRNLRGVAPLDGALKPWMVETLSDPRLPSWVEQWGSPLNLLCRATFEENLARLRGVGARRSIDLEVFFARKANKCLGFVEACVERQAGVDTASLEELRQALDAGAPPERLICTAAIKEAPLVNLCLQHRVTIALDNHDELRLLYNLANGHPPSVALRVSGFRRPGGRLVSRFGFPLEEAAAVAEQNPPERLAIRGVHFHLDGYDPAQRVSGIEQSLVLIDRARRLGHPCSFLDIGGGIPICYLQHRDQWEAFWRRHRQTLQGEYAEATFRGHTLGLTVDGGRLLGEPNVYPFYQELVSDHWLDAVLASPLSNGQTVASALAERRVQLRCEPGRALLEGCGMTVARVVHRRRNESGDLLVGLAMNRTQCRTGSDDFLVDPILVPAVGAARAHHAEFGQGYLTGAYCTESEAILLRKLDFLAGVAVGDLIALPNTAGYFMHFLESRSHQFPLAENVFLQDLD
ncbi:Diaminopimelate decarboxylase [Pirellulimonas nuda]|uniref:Diaminopimelate decarboxylase n=1 Tax=Pirellulimonas nuda TaxID=2528009 RepID=A0A518DDQ3_9BACT|nr:Y4yA family PLP-dependent enzyme [Pirellulimonas nuda]QDU89552.1 Diaminopimelate decarboxylase [Pirellulimonas nuda]